MSEPILYRYHPREDVFVMGLPHRDLTAVDVAFVSPGDLRTGVESGLYELVKDEPKDDKKPSGKAEVTA